LLEALVGRGVTRLVDVRLNPCASDLKPGWYGPKPWTLQPGGSGIVGLLESAGIAYEWLAELGNPQRQDRAMGILREHLADPTRESRVQRGLERLAGLVRQPGAVVAILCACAESQACHRTLIARALTTRSFGGRLTIRDVRAGEVVRPESGPMP
jgi:hypothetical protein